MPIGDTGGMGLSVSIGLKLTGFEALSQIAKELESLQQMALKTEQSFRTMGAALRNSVNMGTSEMMRTAERMERAARTASRSQPSVNPIMGTKEERFAANYENGDFNLRAKAHARALRESERAIRDETAARDKAWSGLGSGIMGGIGVTAAFEAANLARSAIHAATDMNNRLGGLKMQGFSDQEIERIHSQALATRAPGMGTSAKILLQQELGGEVGGLDKVTPEAMQKTALYAQQIHAMTGADTNQTIRDLTKGATAIGGFSGPGGLDVNKFVGNEQMLAQGVLAGRGNVSIEQLRHNYQMASQFLSSQGVQFNKQLQADMIVLTEKYGEQGGVLFNSLMSDVVRGTATHSAQARALLFASGGMSSQRTIGVDPKTMKPVTLQQDSLNIQNGDYMGFFGQERDRQRNLMTRTEGHAPSEAELTRRMAIVLPNFRSGRGQEALMSDTGREQVAKTMEALNRLPTSLEKSAANMMLFSVALDDVKEQAGSLAAELLGPFMKDATKGLLTLGGDLQGLAKFAHEHEGLVRFATDIAETIAGLAALRLAIATLGKTSWLIGKGGKTAAAEGALASRAVMTTGVIETGTIIVKGGVVGGLGGIPEGAKRPGLASTAAKVEGEAGFLGGAGLGTMMGGLKSKLGGMAGRGLTAYLVAGIADAMIDGMLGEDSQIGDIAKNAIEGAGIGSMIPGIWGPIIGAIADPLLKYASSHSLVTPGMSGTEAATHSQLEQRFRNDHLDDLEKQYRNNLNPPKAVEPPPSSSGFLAWSDMTGFLGNRDALIHQRQAEAAARPPVVTPLELPEPQSKPGFLDRPLLSYVPGFAGLYDQSRNTANQRGLDMIAGLKRDDSIMGHMESERAFQNQVPAAVPGAIPGVKYTPNKYDHAVTMGQSHIPIPLPGSMRHPTTPDQMQPHMGDLSKIGTSTITADRLVVGNASGLGGGTGGFDAATQSHIANHSALLGGLGAFHPAALTGGGIPQGTPSARGPIGIHGSAPIIHQGNASDPRGIRNNNPGNLTYMPGQGAIGSDGRFGVYKTMEAGVAANVHQMAINQDKYGITSIRGMINRWAPPGENNTDSYIKSVSTKLGIGPDAKVNFHDPKVAGLMMQAISGVENGRSLDPGIVNRGVGMAMGTPNVQGPQLSAQQADMPPPNYSNQTTLHVHMDGEEITHQIMGHVIDGGLTSSSSATAYDSKMQPLAGGASTPHW